MAAKNTKRSVFEPQSGQLSLAYYGSECVTEIPLTDLYPPDPHPFLVQDDDAMNTLVESVKLYGVREPGLARPLAEGGFELLCGNRRKRACELAGLTTMPVIVRELSDDDAAIVMIDSNLQQRERILPSEKAWAYRLKMEALNHKGVRGENHSADEIAAKTSDSKTQIFRLIRLTELTEVLLDKVDAKQLAFNTAVELSYLAFDEQHVVADAMAKYDVRPSLSQAVRLRKLKQSGTLTAEVIDGVLAEPKKSPVSTSAIRIKYRKYFPPEFSPEQIETVIVGLLQSWQKSEIAQT